VRTVPPQSNTTIVLSLAGQSDARRDTEPAAAGQPEPARERDDTIGQKRFRAAVKGGGHSPVSSAESPTRAVYRSIRQARSSSSTAATTARWRLICAELWYATLDGYRPELGRRHVRADIDSPAESKPKHDIVASTVGLADARDEK